MLRKLNLFRNSYYRVDCPDGSSKLVYENVNDAFPLAFGGYDANISGKIKSKIIEEGELSAGVESKVDKLLYGLDEINNGLALSFRSVYVGYQSDPCSNIEFLLTEISKLNEEQRRLRALKIQILGFIELAKTQSEDSPELISAFNQIVCRIGSPYVDQTSVIEDAFEQNKLAVERLTGGAPVD